MTTNRQTRPTPPARNAIELIRQPNVWFFPPVTLISDPLFGTANPYERRSQFAATLLALGKTVNNQVTDLIAGNNWQATLQGLLDGLPDNTDAILEQLKPALQLGEPQTSQRLIELRTHGSILYEKMDPRLRGKLEEYSLLEGEPGSADEKQFNVTIFRGAEEYKQPIYWNMLYEKAPGESSFTPADAQRFWGFRVAVSQWLDLDRYGEIKLSPAFIGADGGLHFATYEAEATRRAAGASECTGLDKALRAAAATLAGAPVAGDAPGPLWLGDALRQLDPSYEAGRPMPVWLAQQIAALLSGVEVAPGAREPRYGLMHFSCHFVPGTTTQKVRGLRLSMGGATIFLNPDFIEEALTIKQAHEWKWNHPGALVFLNACSTATFSQEYTDLPSLWIEGQGARAVIATICDIPDVFAFAFSLKLYQILHYAQELCAAQQARDASASPPPLLYLDSALLATRRYFLARFNNPLGLAYELFTFGAARLHAPPAMSPMGATVTEDDVAGLAERLAVAAAAPGGP
jgi:hypothetical protein